MRELTAFEISLRDRYTNTEKVDIEGEPDAEKVWLKVGAQSFCVVETKITGDALWYRNSLAKALSVIVLESAHAIETTEDYQKMLDEVNLLVDADPEKGTPEGVRLELLAALIQDYEHQNGL